jgi:hypothetical protein
VQGAAGYLFTGTSVPLVVKPLLVAQRCIDEMGWSDGCQLVARWFSANSSLSTGNFPGVYAGAGAA